MPGHEGDPPYGKLLARPLTLDGRRFVADSSLRNHDEEPHQVPLTRSIVIVDPKREIVTARREAEAQEFRRTHAPHLRGAFQLNPNGVRPLETSAQEIDNN